MHDFLAIAGQGKEDSREGQRYPGELVDDVPQFCGITFQEVPAGGHVEEKVLHGYAGAAWQCHRFLSDHPAIFDLDTGTGLVFGPACPQLDLCNGGDGGQCFTTEAHGADMEEVVDVSDLGSRMPFKCHSRICLAHPFSVVYHLYQRLAGILDKKADISSSGVNRVLEQLLHCAGWSLDDLSGGYLIGNVVGQ
jgi:hypothetical protein